MLAVSTESIIFYTYVACAIAAIVMWAIWLDSLSGGGGGDFVLPIAAVLGAAWPLTMPVLIILWWRGRKKQ